MSEAGPAITTDAALTDGLVYREGELCIEELPVRRLLEHHPTPLVVFSRARLLSNALQVRRAFGDQTLTLFSYKSCYLAGVLRAIHECQIGAEVSSGREYALARSLGVPLEKISWNGPAFSDEEAQTAVCEGVGCIGINTRDDLERVAAIARKHKRNARIMLRIYPAGIDGGYLPRGSRLGLDVADGTAEEVARMALAIPEVTLLGFHCHTQVNQVSPEGHSKALASAVKFARHLKSLLGYEASMIGIGGGFAGRTEMARAGSDISDFAGPFNQALAELPWPVNLIIEPGRYFVDDAAVGITRVISRTSAAGRPWWIVDLGTQFLVPFSGREFEVAPAILSDSAAGGVSIGDRLSSFSGVIKRDALLPLELPEGLLAILAVGAYTFSTAQRFMYGMPEIILVDRDRVEVLWHRESDDAWVNQIMSAGSA